MKKIETLKKKLDKKADEIRALISELPMKDKYLTNSQQDHLFDTVLHFERAINGLHQADMMSNQEVLNLYLKKKFTDTDDDIIDHAISENDIDSDDILDHWRGWMRENHNSLIDTDEKYEVFADFDEYFDNGLTFKQNLKAFKEWNVESATAQ